MLVVLAENKKRFDLAPRSEISVVVAVNERDLI
jgi:hypothetical protein